MSFIENTLNKAIEITSQNTDTLDKIQKIRKNRGTLEDSIREKNKTLGSVFKYTNNIVDTVGNLTDSFTPVALERFANNGITANVKIEIGDHVYVQRLGYTHHGIYVGNNMVVHYLKASVKKTTLETFTRGATIYKKNNLQSPTKYTSREVATRALFRLNEDNYSLIFNNCESFAKWCRNGSALNN